jgi:hypothetical protein
MSDFERLARAVVGPLEITLIHRGHPGEAVSRIRSTASGFVGTGWAYQVDGQVVRYGSSSGALDSSVKVRDLVAWAAGILTPEAGQRVCDAYRAYVQAATAPYTEEVRPELPPEMLEARRRARQDAYSRTSAALTRAARDALSPPESDPGDGGLFSCPPRQQRRLLGELVGAR